MTFDDLITHYGTQAEAARRLGLSQPSIHEWQHSTIPYDRQCQIQIETGGKLRASKDHDAREIAKREQAA